MKKSPFDFWEQNGFLEYSSGDVRIYNIDGEQFLFIGQIIYASTTERDWYIRNLMPLVKGSVLEIGLGLGCASKVILANPMVENLLTIEKNEYVISAFGKPLRKHMILIRDINDWLSEMPANFPIFDTIFVDHYTLEDEDTLEELNILSSNLEPLLKEGGNLVFWIDENADDELKKEVKKLWLHK